MARGSRLRRCLSAYADNIGHGGVNGPTLSPTYKTPFMTFGVVDRESETLLFQVLDKPSLWKEHEENLGVYW